VIELMITVAVCGVLAAVVVPELSTFLKNSSLRGSTYDLLSAVTIARSEAVKRGSRVILCRTADPHASTPACGGATKDWSTGWLVFVAEDTDDDFDAGTDVLVTTGNPTTYGITLRTNTTSDANLIFRADGATSSASTARFVACDSRGATAGREITITRVGRPDLVAGDNDSPLATCTPS
jgi:type IV fimbrial biogenesis protein FimT